MPHEATVEQAVDALLSASRGLVGIAAVSLADTDDVTVPQWRALVLVSSRPRTTVTDLAGALGIHPTSATRLCDRLVRKRLLRRLEADDDRRRTELHLAPAGRRLVDRVTARRRTALRRVAGAMDAGELEAVTDGLLAFARHLDESFAGSDLLGWDVGS